MITCSLIWISLLIMCYFCSLNPKSMVMKKIVFVAIVCLSVVLGACHHNVTTQYTIGCLGFQHGTIEGSQWQTVEDYFKSNVEYNKLVSFEGTSLAENDKQARQFYDKQMEKIDKDYVCSLLSGSDYFIYGIATLNASGTYRFVKAMKFASDGATEISE